MPEGLNAPSLQLFDVSNIIDISLGIICSQQDTRLRSRLRLVVVPSYIQLDDAIGVLLY